MKLLLLLLAFLGAVFAQTSEHPDHLSRWEQFKVHHRRQYQSEEEDNHRFGIFVQNLNRAAERNAAGSEQHGVTKFMDLTPEEFKSTLLNFQPILRTAPANLLSTTTPPIQHLPINCSNSSTNCNYANLGVVTPVKDQGNCGSCWAFSATESVETAWAEAGNPLIQLAPQQIVDCDTVDLGCSGGDPRFAYQYVLQAGGLEKESNYSYVARQSTCNFSAPLVAATISGYNWGITPCNTYATQACNAQNETGLWSVVQFGGPQSICVDAEPWQTYVSGIFNSTKCYHSYSDLDHCVHLTGYGVANGVRYWLVKNQWGTNWGEHGYIRLAYGRNMCGLANEVTHAIV